MGLNLKALIGKLNDQARSALEGAAGLCLSRTHYDIEIEHFLTKMLESQASDFAKIVKHFGIDKSRLTGELMRSMDKLKSGNARTPAISPSVLKMLTQAWTIGSIDFNASQVRTGFTILALVTDDDLARITREISREFQKIQPEALRNEFAKIVADSSEETVTAVADSEGAPAAPGRAIGGKTPNLDQFTVNLTENAKNGKIDPVLGRDFEIRQVIDILTRRRQNNPILTGEAGVGKTAVVEGFALRVAQGDVPPPLRNVTVRTLDLALLQAGAGVKGEFENRLKGLIEEVKSSPTPIILFIDEAHTMIGAGGQAGQNDAANLLKPALARGELRTIAATTWAEFKKYFEKDPALARRFQVVKVEEPTEQQCMVMMRGIVGSLEKHHKVRILEEAVAAGVRLSHRYLAGRQLPDMVVGVDHTERLAQLASQKGSVQASLKALQDRWDKEKGLVVQIREIREKLERGAAAAKAVPTESGNGDSAAAAVASAGAAAVASAAVATAAPAAAPEQTPDELRTQLSKLENELSALQGETGLIRVCVDAQIVGEVISAWTGIPVGKMLKDEIATILSLQQIGRASC